MRTFLFKPEIAHPADAHHDDGDHKVTGTYPLNWISSEAGPYNLFRTFKVGCDRPALETDIMRNIMQVRGYRTLFGGCAKGH